MTNRTNDIFILNKGEILGAYGVRSYLGWKSLDDEDRIWRIAREDVWVSPGSRFVRTSSGNSSAKEEKENIYNVSLTSETPLNLFTGFPRTYILVGSAEILVDDSTILYERMKADGVHAILDVEEGAVHEFLCFKRWGDEERIRVADRVGKWIDHGALSN